MNPQNQPYYGQQQANPTPVGQFPMGAAGQNYMGMPGQMAGQSQANPAMQGGLPPVPGQSPVGVQPAQYGAPPGQYAPPSQPGQFMPPVMQQPQPAAPLQLPTGPQGSAAAQPAVAGTAAQQAIARAKQAVLQYANNPFEMVQAVQQIRGEYLSQQFNISSKSTDA